MLDSVLGQSFLKYLKRGLKHAVLPLYATALVGQLPNRLPPEMSNEPNPKPAHHHATSAKDVQEKLQKGLDNKNAAYAGSSIKTSVDDQNVTLTGTVSSELQHEMALQLARAYGEDRNIVDHLTIQQ